MTYIGIDYGMGTSNRDPENGIRYGVISQHSVLQAWADSSEPDYGEPTCPKCGGIVGEYDGDKHNTYDEYRLGCADYACEPCKIILDSQDVFGEEPIGWNVDDGEYKLVDCLDSDIMVLKSPYFTYAQYCSPCVPGAGNLDSPMKSGVKCYCLGHDWFEDEIAPYPVFSVETGKRI